MTLLIVSARSVSKKYIQFHICSPNQKYEKIENFKKIYVSTLTDKYIN